MTIKPVPEKEYFLEGDAQNKELVSRYKDKQNWVYYVIIGSFGLITFLNFMFPNYHWTGPEPMDVKWGFIAVLLTFFGTLFFFRTFILSPAETWSDLYWWACVILTIVLLYFGLPILFG